MTLRTCLDCGKVCEGSRCQRHQASVRPGYNYVERKRRAEAVRAHRESFGDWCPGWNRAAHHLGPGDGGLAADHIVPVARGGREDGPLQVLCQSCNSRKGTRTPEDDLPIW